VRRFAGGSSEIESDDLSPEPFGEEPSATMIVLVLIADTLLVDWCVNRVLPDLWPAAGLRAFSGPA
jgi:hypothetical protein